ncbi:MAG: carboxy terminal-processing peptidase [Bacteroidota bacterium]
MIRFKRMTLLALVVIGLGTLAFKSIDWAQGKNEILMRAVVGELSARHYAPYKLNDDFAGRVFDLYLKRMDNGKRYFTQSEIDRLEKYRTQLDDQIRVGNFEFFELTEKMQEISLARVQGFYKEILIAPFDFGQDESYVFYPEDITWAKDEDELKERWRKTLKYQTLVRIDTKMDLQEEAKEDGDPLEEKQTFAEIEQDARAKVMKTYDDWVKRMDKVDTDDRRAVFINAIVNTYDPHTVFFPPKQKENFDIQMSGKLEGIGATLQEKDGYISVVRIVPGSASYRQGELQSEDVILKVAQGTEDPVDIVDMRLDDAVKLIRGAKGTEVRLTVKKVDGKVTVIPIIRDVVILEETFAKSAIIHNEHTEKGIGYIKLPKFYADFNDRNGRRCAKDVKKEITKLKEQGIDGLVLDLRNNGGGSLTDVVDMAGLFVEQGPIVQVKGRFGRPYIFQDEDPSVHYDGPLVIMVNSSSASASEIMAAAIQDYKRGIIVGTPTFGKGTVQHIVNLDQSIAGIDRSLMPLGAMKLTVQKFYRINGDATQRKGVTPDVILPDAYTYIDRGEKEEEHSMPWDEISPVGYDVWGLSASDYTQVRKASRDRMQGNSIFTKIDENARRIKRRQDVHSRTLNLDAHRAEQKELKEISDAYKEMFQPIENLQVVNLPSDLETINQDTVRQQINQDWIDGLLKDVYVQEATAILDDLE